MTSKSTLGEGAHVPSRAAEGGRSPVCSSITSDRALETEARVVGGVGRFRRNKIYTTPVGVGLLHLGEKREKS